MLLFTEALLIGLASWRLAHLLIEEDGPFSIFERIRGLAGIREGLIKGFFPKLFSCIWCMSVWTALLAYILWEINPIIVVVIAAMAIAILVDSLANFSSN